MTNNQIQTATTDDEIIRCFPVMVQLRPHLGEQEFLHRVRLQQAEGYRLAYLCVSQNGGDVVKATAGFRLLNLLTKGRVCYVDDLVTDADSRSQGHGDALLDWLVAWSREQGCTAFTLDSGVQRREAHRFYFRKRMTISSYHFVMPLE